MFFLDFLSQINLLTLHAKSKASLTEGLKNRHFNYPATMENSPLSLKYYSI